MPDATVATRPSRPRPPGTDERIGRAGLAVVLAVALAVRLWIIATHTYIIFPDETFQYLEPAHRLAFGSGVITWEFLDGIRSWALPGVLAGLMRLTAMVSPGPETYVLVARSLCVLASLSVPYVGYRLALRRYGPAPAMLTGLLCALASESVYFAPVIMTEPLATDAALLAIWLGDSAADGPSPRRRLVLAGLLFGLAASLRYQFAPVLGLAALVQHARRPRDLAAVAAAGIAVVVLLLGVLDTLTWGVPFQSVWLNYIRNAAQGVSGAMGTQSWLFYPTFWIVAWGAMAGVLLLGAVYGAASVPVLGVVVAGTIGLHSLVQHKELRFVFLATACMPMLAGIGLGRLMQRVPRLRPAGIGVPAAALVGVALSAYTAMADYGRATPPDAWHRDRSVVRATLAAREVPGACALAIRSRWVYRTGGYSYWDRNLPIYFETWEQAQILKHSAFRLRLDSVTDGRHPPQYPDAALAAHADAFNVMIGEPGDGLPGFSRTACFGAGTEDDPSYCVFTRPGGCQ